MPREEDERVPSERGSASIVSRATGKLVIAVFGGSEHDEEREALAKRIGEAIAARRYILLTGGTEPKPCSVKNMAIMGAYPSPWVGVPQESGPVQPADTENPGLVIKSGLKRKRNYLEAWMCDAAVALFGESGTRSEVAFSLSLGRPVAFVGKCWRGLCDDLKDRGLRALRDELDAAIQYVGQSEFVDKRQILERLEKRPQLTFACFGPAATPVEVIEWIERNASPGTGSFPEEAGLDAWKAQYDTWREKWTQPLFVVCTAGPGHSGVMSV